MVRENFEKELQRIKSEVLALGSMVEHAIVASVESLKQQDHEEAQRLIEQDHVMNEKRYMLENDALTLIATQQPMARDLRFIAAVLNIVSELERIGDYAKGIAKINLMIGDDPLLKPLIDLPRMAERTQDMLHRSLQAFNERDVELARGIPAEDDEVDALYNQIYRELLTYIMSDPGNIDRATYLLWAAHNLERAADRVTNICERVIFTVTGELVEMSKGEEKTYVGLEDIS
jgi:phosphate transport system protein